MDPDQIKNLRRSMFNKHGMQGNGSEIGRFHFINGLIFCT